MKKLSLFILFFFSFSCSHSPVAMREVASTARCGFDLTKKEWSTGYQEDFWTDDEWEMNVLNLTSLYGLDKWSELGYTESIKFEGKKYKMKGLAETLSWKGLAVRENTYQQLKDLSGSKYHDPYLILTIAFRESGGVAFSTENEMVNTFEKGGLDNLGAYLEELKTKKHIPVGYGKMWKAVAIGDEELKANVKPALVPRNEMVIAYGAWINRQGGKLKSALEEFGFSYEDFLGQPMAIQRILRAFYFAGPGGKLCVKTNAESKCKIKQISPSSFGLKSVLSYLKENNLKLDGFVQDKEVLTFKRSRLAIMWGVQAELLEAYLFNQCME